MTTCPSYKKHFNLSKSWSLDILIKTNNNLFTKGLQTMFCVILLNSHLPISKAVLFILISVFYINTQFYDNYINFFLINHIPLDVESNMSYFKE